eukprot:scaffold66093_cov48-Attheya_sp.AAC.2
MAMATKLPRAICIVIRSFTFADLRCHEMKVLDGKLVPVDEDSYEENVTVIQSLTLWMIPITLVMCCGSAVSCKDSCRNMVTKSFKFLQ